MNFVINLIVSLFWPFLGLIIGLKKIRIRRYGILILIFVLISSFMVLPYEDGDIRLYQNTLDYLTEYGSDQTLFGLIYTLLIESGSELEIFVPVNVFIISSFTNNIAFAYLITGFVFYIIWIKLIRELAKEYFKFPKANSKLILLLLISFSLYIIFFRAINGRFYLAYWLAIMSIYFIFFKEDKWYYLLLACSVLIHQSYIFVVGLLLVFQLINSLRKFKWFDDILVILFFVGIAFSEFSVGFVRDNIEHVSYGVADNYSDFVKESYVESQSVRDRKWFLEYRTPVLFFIAYFLLLRLKYSKKVIINGGNYVLFQFVLVFSVINTFTFNIPSFGERFRNVLIGFILLTLFKIYNENRIILYKTHLILLIISFFAYKLVTFRVYAEYINLYAYFPLPLLWEYISPEGFSLFDFIK